MLEPDWLIYARRFIGLKEIPGTQHNPIIVDWAYRLRAWWRDDETPWCGLAVAVWMSYCGIGLPRHWMRARDWLNWGFELRSPQVGCVVVFSRKSGGHVGLVVGEDQNKNLMVLGGNQGNKVSIAPFSKDRVLGYRWPTGKVVRIGKLPTIQSHSATSSNEA